MSTQIEFPFWDKVIDKKSMENKLNRERRKHEWIEKNLKKSRSEIITNNLTNSKRWENM